MHTIDSTAITAGASHDAATASRSERWLPTSLSAIAGMVNLIGFLSLGIFTARITGNVVVIGRRGAGLMRLLLLFQLITSVLIFSVITKPSANPHGLMATIAAMIAVTAMGCQFALSRLTLPVVPFAPKRPRVGATSAWR